MAVLGLTLVAVLASPLAHPCTPKSGAVIRMGVGTQKVLTEPEGRAIWTEDKGIEIRAIENDQFLVICMELGTFHFTVQRTTGKEVFTVIAENFWDWDMRICEVCKAFPCSTHLTLKMVGDRLYIEGLALDLEDWNAARKAHLLYPNVIILAKLDPRFAERAMSEARLALWESGFPYMNVYLEGKHVVIDGDVPPSEVEKVHAIARPWIAHIDALLDPDAPEPKEIPPPPPGPRPPGVSYPEDMARP